MLRYSARIDMFLCYMESTHSLVNNMYHQYIQRVWKGEFSAAVIRRNTWWKGGK